MYSEPPEPPTNVYITEVSSRSISLAWYPAFDGNSPVLHYMVQYKERASPWREQNNLTVGGAASAVVVTDLEPYTEYQLHVVSVNSIGAGPPSKVVTAVTSEEGKHHYCSIPALLSLFDSSIWSSKICASGSNFWDPAESHLACKCLLK